MYLIIVAACTANFGDDQNAGCSAEQPFCANPKADTAVCGMFIFKPC